MNCKHIVEQYFKTPGLLKTSIEKLLISLEMAISTRMANYKSQTRASFWLGLFIVTIYQYFIWKSFFNLEEDLSDFSNFGAKYFTLAPIAAVIVILFHEIFEFFKKDTFFSLIFANFATLGIFAALLEMAHFKFKATLIISFYLLTVLINVLVWIVTIKLNSSLRTFVLLLTGGAIAVLISYFPNSNSLLPNLLLFHFYRFAFVFTSLDPKQVLPIENLRTARVLAFIFSPSYLTTPLPVNFSQWRVSTDEIEKRQLKSKAAVYLIICFIFLLFMKEVKPLRAAAHKEIDIYFWKWHAFGLANYLYFFLFSYVNITLPISLMWWCGIKLPNPYVLPLLAVTPQDRWRRWNTYFYEWFFKFIYLPVFRRSSSLIVSILAVFGVTFILHASRYSDMWILDVETYPSIRNMTRKYLFFLAHGFLVYIGIRYSKYWPDENKASGWLGVLLMMFLMSFIHGIFILI